MMEKEFREANRRIKRGIERNYLIAMARLEGMTPEEYAAKLDAEAAAALAAMPSAMEQLGAHYRRLNDAFVKMAEDFARGWQAAGN